MDKNSTMYIIDNESEKNLYSFYLYDSILYYKSNKDTSKNDTKIIDNVKNFDLCINKNQTIYILCILNSGNLIYITFKNDTWHKTTLYTFPNDVNSIDQVKIFTTDDTVHVFYDFKILTPNVNFYNYKSFIMHGYKKTQYEWIQAYIGTFPKSITPKYFVNFDSDKNLHYFYLSQDQKLTTINRLVFNKKRMKWFEPENIELNINNAKLLNVLLDKNDTIHFIVKDIDTNYVYHNSITGSSDKNNEYTLITSNKDACNFKILKYDKKLYISWKYQNIISYITSDDLGNTWNDTIDHYLPELKNLRYFYLDNKTKSFKYISSFGTLENNEVLILGINDICIPENNTIETDTYNDELLLNFEQINNQINEKNKEEEKEEKYSQIENNLSDDIIEDQENDTDYKNAHEFDIEYKEQNETNVINNTINISDIDNSNSNYKKDKLETNNNNIHAENKVEQSLWKKITNYLTLKE